MQDDTAAKAFAEATQDEKPAEVVHSVTPSEFDGAQAVGTWIIAEQVPVGDKKLGNLIVPGTVRMVVWKAISVGPKCDVGVQVGDRVLFINPLPPVTVDGRTFAFLRPDQIACTLPMPVEAPMVQLATSFHKGGSLQ